MTPPRDVELLVNTLPVIVISEWTLFHSLQNSTHLSCPYYRWKCYWWFQIRVCQMLAWPSCSSVVSKISSTNNEGIVSYANYTAILLCCIVSETAIWNIDWAVVCSYESSIAMLLFAVVRLIEIESLYVTITPPMALAGFSVKVLLLMIMVDSHVTMTPPCILKRALLRLCSLSAMWRLLLWAIRTPHASAILFCMNELQTIETSLKAMYNAPPVAKDPFLSSSRQTYHTMYMWCLVASKWGLQCCCC